MIKEISLGRLSKMLGGALFGSPDAVVNSISAPERHADGSISPLWEKKFVSSVKKGAVLLTKKGWMPEGCSGIEVDDPRRSLTDILDFLSPEPEKNAGVDAGATVAPDAVIGEGAAVGPSCVVSSGARIGRGSCLKGLVWVGKNVVIGEDTVIDPGVVLYDGITIGSRCIIHASAVIGCDGFGFMPDPKKGLRRIPQIGTVVIGDDVEIGASTSVDRATFGETLISKGCKIDSHVKIGHNCRIGEYSIVVAQSGVAGSSVIGRGVTMAAQSGVANHATIGDGAIVAGRSGVASDIPAGMTVSGFPAQEHIKDMRQTATFRHLPEMEKKIRELAAKVKELEAK